MEIESGERNQSDDLARCEPMMTDRKPDKKNRLSIFGYSTIVCLRDCWTATSDPTRITGPKDVTDNGLLYLKQNIAGINFAGLCCVILELGRVKIKNLNFGQRTINSAAHCHLADCFPIYKKLFLQHRIQ